ncbi:MAG: insulinase family protein [Phycisphaeraceae bacterium]|nr:insulinase family protein [Phycisphaeraceae bacterium]
MSRSRSRVLVGIVWGFVAVAGLGLPLGSAGAASGVMEEPARVLEPGMMDFEERVLRNGLRVITLEDRSCPVVSVQVWYRVGSKDENPERQGFAHMFEHMMFRGTDRLGPTSHFDLLRKVGGNANAYTSFDQTVYHQTLPSNQLELALYLEAERMSFLKIDQDSFDTERKVVEEERRMGTNQPYGTALEQALPALFGEHPYKWSPIGQIPHLRAATVQELRDFWNRYYVPNNAVLVIAGDIEHERAQRLAADYFGWIPKGEDPARVTYREPLPTQPRTVVIREENAPAPVLGIAYRTVPMGHPDSWALQMLATIVGGGESSRLYQKLVTEQKSAVFAAGGALSLEQDGLIAFGAVMAPFGANPKRVRDAIDAELARVREELVSEDELEKARNQMLKGMVAESLTVDSKATALGSAAALEGRASNVNDRLRSVRAVTREDLRRVANEYMDPSRQIALQINRNLLGAIFSKMKKEDEAEITGERELGEPIVGRPGVVRPETFPAEPPLAPLPSFDPTPVYAERSLENGLRLLIVENHEVPYVSVQLGLHAGAWTEAKPGTASMATGMLTKGTKTRGQSQIASELETYGITLAGAAGLDNANVVADCMPEHLERAMMLMADVVMNPTFPEDEFDKARTQMITGLNISSNTPAYIADREFRKRLYGAHPYARTATGEVSDVNALTRADLAEWWGTFARPDMAVLIFAGDVTPDRAQALAAEAFGNWRAQGEKPAITLPEIPEAAPMKIVIVDRPGSVQSEIRIGRVGFTRHDPRYAASRVASGYFGGAFNARLNETIRVKKGLTYGARGGFSSSRFAGEFSASTFTKTPSTAETVQTIFDEIERLRYEAPSEKELNDTKAYITGSFVGARETPQAVAGDLWLMESSGLGRDYFKSMLGGVAGTSAEDCTRLAQEMIDPARLVVVVTGDASQIKESLEKIGPVEVVKARE